MINTKKITIPAILTVTVLLAGIFAFSPIEEASTVHTTILDASYETKRIAVNDQSNANADFSCDNNADDGTVTFTLDGATDSAVLVSLIIDVDEATDAGDNLAIDINADDIEISTGAGYDGAPAGPGDALVDLDIDGGADTTSNFGPIGFRDTIKVDINCTFGNGDLDYTIIAFFEAPDSAVITPTENIL